MEYRTEMNASVDHGATRGVLPAEVPEIPRRMSQLFDDLHELRETALYLSNRLEVIMAPSAPTSGSPEKVSQDPSTGLGTQIVELNTVVSFTRNVLGDVINRLEL